MRMFAVKGTSQPRFLCDIDVKRLYRRGLKILEAKKYSMSGSRLLISYLSTLAKELKYRFNEVVDDSYRMSLIAGLDIGDWSDHNFEIEVIDVLEYQVRAAAYAQWSNNRPVPHEWARIGGNGRLFCPLPRKLTSQKPFSMEVKEKEKTSDVGEIYKEIAHFMRSLGVRPIKRIDVEKMLVIGETPKKKAIALVRDRYNLQKAMKYIAEKEYEVKINLNHLKKAHKKGKEFPYLESLGLHPVSFMAQVYEPFHKLGLKVDL